MGYLKAVTEAPFKTTASGQRVFFPFGVFARGRVLPDEQAGRAILRVIKCHYGAAWVVIPLLIFCRLDWLSICGIVAGMSGLYYMTIYAKVRALPFADERLGWGEVYRQMARNMGRWRCWGVCLMCTVLSALAVLAAVTKGGGPFEIWQVLVFAGGMLLGAAFSGWLAWLAPQDG